MVWAPRRQASRRLIRFPIGCMLQVIAIVTASVERLWSGCRTLWLQTLLQPPKVGCDHPGLVVSFPPAPVCFPALPVIADGNVGAQVRVPSHCPGFTSLFPALPGPSFPALQCFG